MTTQEHLNQFGLTIADAHSWIMANLNDPKTVFDTAVTFGVNSQMLAEIVGNSFPGIRAPEVENFFSSLGFDGSALGNLEGSEPALEPPQNDSFQVGTKQSFTLNQGETGEHLLNMQEGVYYQINLSAINFTNYSKNFTFTDGTPLTTVTNGMEYKYIPDFFGQNNFGSSDVVPQTDDYLLSIDPNTDNIAEYTLSFDQFGQMPLANAEVLTNDDHGDFAATGTLINPASLTEGVALNEDKDWFTVELEQNQYYEFALNGEFDGTSVILDLFDPYGEKLGGIHADNDSFGFQANESGIYHLRVWSLLTESGLYELEFDQFGISQYEPNTPPGDGDDHHNIASLGTVITPNSTTDGAIETLGDNDWFTAELQAGQTYQFGLTELETQNLFTGIFNIYDAQGNKLDGTTAVADLELTPEATGFYHIEVLESGDNQTGNYQLEFLL